MSQLPAHKSPAYKHLFGPIVSRRLGRSLGIDLVPFKTCTFDCIYCQLGSTTVHTIERREYVPINEVLDELERKLNEGTCDWVTLAGSGEPTLYGPLEPLIRAIKAMTTIPVAVITNGSLLWMPEVRQALLPVDLVIPSLDAATPDSFQRVNQPHAEITFDRIISGLRTFRNEFKNQLWLEIFLVEATTTEAEIEKMAELVAEIDPDKVQINTVVRPSKVAALQPVSREVLERCAAHIGHNAEIIAAYPHMESADDTTITEQDVLGLVRRHPDTVEGIARGLGASQTLVAQLLAQLAARGAVAAEPRDDTIYYSGTHDS